MGIKYSGYILKIPLRLKYKPNTSFQLNRNNIVEHGKEDKVNIG